jgi:hypothetical protein
MDLFREYAYSLLPKLESQEVSAEALVNSCFQRIEAIDEKIHAFTEVYKEDALKTAKDVDNQRKQGKKVGKFSCRDGGAGFPAIRLSGRCSGARMAVVRNSLIYR